jgi:hypothetical protein
MPPWEHAVEYLGARLERIEDILGVGAWSNDPDARPNETGWWIYNIVKPGHTYFPGAVQVKDDIGELYLQWGPTSIKVADLDDTYWFCGKVPILPFPEE